MEAGLHAASEVTVAEGTLGEPSVAECIQKRMRRWVFRPSDGLTTVTFPWKFEPATESP